MREPDATVPDRQADVSKAALPVDTGCHPRPFDRLALHGPGGVV